MRETLKLAIDIDGVLANFTKGYAAKINELFPGTIPEGYEPQDWDWTAVLSPAAAVAAWKAIEQDETFWEYLDCYCDNAQALYAFLHEYPEVEVYYVTARARTVGKTLLAQTKLWLAQRGLVSENTSIIPVTSGKKKGEVYAALGINMSIDDAWSNVAASINVEGHRGNDYLLDRPWNRNISYKLRIGSLRQFLAIAKVMLSPMPEESVTA